MNTYTCMYFMYGLMKSELTDHLGALRFMYAYKSLLSCNHKWNILLTGCCVEQQNNITTGSPRLQWLLPGSSTSRNRAGTWLRDQQRYICERISPSLSSYLSHLAFSTVPRARSIYFFAFDKNKHGNQIDNIEVPSNVTWHIRSWAAILTLMRGTVRRGTYESKRRR